MSDQAADATREAFYAWDCGTSRHVVHGTKYSIEALRQRLDELEAALAEERVCQDCKEYREMLEAREAKLTEALREGMAGAGLSHWPTKEPKR